MWTKVVGHLHSKKINGKEREQGVLCQVRIRKNRITGRDRSTVVPILHSFGIDDIGSMVDFLVEEGRWNAIKKEGEADDEPEEGKKKRPSRINAPDFDMAGSREKIIQHIEAEGLEKELKMLVSDTFNQIEEACSVKRKSRYS